MIAILTIYQKLQNVIFELEKTMQKERCYIQNLISYYKLFLNFFHCIITKADSLTKKM